MPKQTLSAQIVELQNEVARLHAELDDKDETIKEIEKKLDIETKSKDSFYNSRHALQKELNEIHSFLDGLPNPVPKTYVVKSSWGSEQESERSILTRLTAWVAGLVVKVA